jgi:ubiquitin carboxyl-terminal hydrolase 5/13
VKLGTITPEGGGDVYCYTCDESRVDPALPEHLMHFGMDVVDMRKTDKSMTELVSARRAMGE